MDSTHNRTGRCRPPNIPPRHIFVAQLTNPSETLSVPRMGLLHVQVLPIGASEQQKCSPDSLAKESALLHLYLSHPIMFGPPIGLNPALIIACYAVVL